jgi:hypothetical protein
VARQPDRDLAGAGPPPGMTARTERHLGDDVPDAAREGQKGMPQEAQA